MSGTVKADTARNGEEYSGSPAPFALFLGLFLVFLVLAILSVSWNGATRLCVAFLVGYHFVRFFDVLANYCGD